MEQNWFWRRAGMRAGLALSAAVGGSLSADGRVMDPMMSALVRLVRRRPPDASAIGKLRTDYASLLALAGLRSHPMASDPAVDMRPLAIPGLPPAREYVPRAEPLGTLLYFHGGGFVMGSPALRDGLCRRLAAGTRLRVVSAAYRLAPEHPYPAAHEDAATALAWVRGQHNGKLLVGGDSAGANLAAGLALNSEAGAGVDGQVLIYPVVDMMQSAGLYPSLDAFADGYLLTAAGMEACAQALIPPGTNRGDARLSPIRADVSRAAPALIAVAGFDPLRDQGTAYAEALRAAGRPVELLEEPALVHGYADFAGVVPAARRAVDRLIRAVGAMA